MLLELMVAMLLAGQEKAAKPKVELTVFPRAAVWSPGLVPVFRVELKIRNADETLWCPNVRWEWPDGTNSVEEDDCDPYDEADPADIAEQSWTKRIELPPGDWKVAVILSKAGHVVQRREVDIQVVR
jgi:hypothetical protein